MNSRRPPNAYAGVRRNFIALIQDAFRLGDLQLQLFQVDAIEFWKKTKLAAIVCAVSALGMLAALPIFLLGITYYVQSAFEISLATASLIVALATITLGGLAAWLSVKNVTRAGGILARSKEEFRQNMAWLRSAMNQQSEED